MTKAFIHPARVTIRATLPVLHKCLAAYMNGDRRRKEYRALLAAIRLLTNAFSRESG